MQESSTHQISVKVETSYIEEQSDPSADRFVFAYTITIKNEGTLAAQLLNRHWVITDSNGKVQEVKGEGVVGEQPHLKPGDRFRYTSGAILETEVGSMEGSYEMQDDRGNRFQAPIMAFSLTSPAATLH